MRRSLSGDGGAKQCGAGERAAEIGICVMRATSRSVLGPRCDTSSVNERGDRGRAGWRICAAAACLGLAEKVTERWVTPCSMSRKILLRAARGNRAFCASGLCLTSTRHCSRPPCWIGLTAETRALIVAVLFAVKPPPFRSYDPPPHRIGNPQRQDDGAEIVPDPHRFCAIEPAGTRILGMHQQGRGFPVAVIGSKPGRSDPLVRGR